MRKDKNDRLRGWQARAGAVRDRSTPQAELRGHLARLSVTQEGLAMMLGVHLRTLARWLAGGPVPRVAIFACRYLETIGVGGRIRLLREFNNRGK